MASRYIDNAAYGTSGYTLSGAYSTVTLGPSGTVGGPGIAGSNQQAYTIVNLGSITGSTSAIYLRDGGSVTNSGTAALVAGLNGVVIQDGGGLVGNDGTIESTGDATFNNYGGQISAFGVYRGDGGGVANNAGGTIVAIGSAGVGVQLAGAGTVTNAGTIEALGTGGRGIVLQSSGYVGNSGTAALIEGYRAGVLLTGGVGCTLDNSGTIKATGTQGAGAEASNGGMVANAGTAALISGYFGVEVTGGTGTITNAGTIESSAASDLGVYLGVGGSVSNTSTAALITGYTGIKITGGAATVSNSGIVEGTGARGNGISVNYATISNTGTIETTGVGAGIFISSAGVLTTGGTVTNSGTAALIKGIAGVYFYGITGTVINSGTIEATGTTQGNELGAGGVRSVDGGFINNIGSASLIEGYIGVSCPAGTVSNAGTILGANVRGATGIFDPLVAYNAKTGLIEAYTGIKTQGTLTNFGTIKGTGGFYSSAVYVVGSNGTISNGKGALIEGYFGVRTVNQFASSWSVGNLGTIDGTGVYGVDLEGGGSVANNASYAVIEGSEAGISVRNEGGSISNLGMIDGTGSFAAGVALLEGGIVGNSAGALIEGSGYGIHFENGAGTLQNYGTIKATAGTGVSLESGGIVTNASGGLILASSDGVEFEFASGTATNTGTIVASGSAGSGIYLEDGGVVTNSGKASLITGIVAGVTLFRSGIVTNAGTIQGGSGVRIEGGYGTLANSGTILATGASGYAVYLEEGGMLSNTAGALIEATGSVAIANLGTLTIDNFGTIEALGADGIAIKSSGGLLMDEAGSSFVGQVIGGGGTLELSGTPGTLSGLGTSFSGFGIVDVLAGAAWSLMGTNVVANGTTSSLIDSGVLTLRGTSTIAGTVSGAGTLLLSGTEALDSGTDLSVSHLTLAAGRATLGADLAYAGGFAEHGGTLALGSKTLTLNGAAGFTAGVVSGTGVLSSDKAVSLAALTITGGAVWRDFGTVTDPGKLTLGGAGSATGRLTVESAGSFDITGTGGIAVAAGGTGSVVNAGLFEKTAGIGVSTIAGSITDTGTITVATGTLDFTGAANSFAGTIHGAGTVQFGAGKTTLAAKTVLSVAHVVLSGGTVTLKTNLSYAGGFTEHGGTLALGGKTLILNGIAGFTGGAVSGTGVLATHNAVNLSALTVTGGAVWQDFGTVTDTGKLTLGGAGGASGHLAIESTGIFDITGNGGIAVVAGGSGAIANAHLFEKTGGTGLSIIAPAIANTGTILVTAGTLDLAGAVSGAGKETIGVKGTLEFGGSVTANQTVSFAGATGELILHDPSGSGLGFAGTVAGFRKGDLIDLATFAFIAGAKPVWTQNGTKGTLTLTEGSKTAKITLFGQYAAAGFHAAKNTAGGTTITYTPPATKTAGLGNPHH